MITKNILLIAALAAISLTSLRAQAPGSSPASPPTPAAAAATGPKPEASASVVPPAGTEAPQLTTAQFSQLLEKNHLTALPDDAMPKSIYVFLNWISMAGQFLAV